MGSTSQVQFRFRWRNTHPPFAYVLSSPFPSSPNFSYTLSFELHDQARLLDSLHGLFPSLSFTYRAGNLTSVSDPDPHWSGSPGSGSVLGILIRIRIQEQGNWLKLTTNLFYSLSKWILYQCGYLCFMTYYGTYIKYIFHFKIQFFVMAKSDQVQNAYPHRSALVWFPGTGSALR